MSDDNTPRELSDRVMEATLLEIRKRDRQQDFKDNDEEDGLEYDGNWGRLACRGLGITPDEKWPWGEGRVSPPRGTSDA